MPPTYDYANYLTVLGGVMPRCLDCDNTLRFSYMENSYNEAEYDESGELVDVTYKEYHSVEEGKCLSCESSNIEGDL